MPQRQAHREAILKDRYLFLERRQVPDWLPRPLVSSWQRSADLGVSPERPQDLGPMVQKELSLARERSATLLRLAELELDALAECISDAPCMVLLTDADGVVLERRGNLSFLPKADQVALQPGADWSERMRGTNAIGTALADLRSTEVWSYQHFCSVHDILTCTASPIVTPTGELAGVLDVSGDAAMPAVHARGLVQMAVAQIEHRWFHQEHGGRRMLTMHANPALLGTWQEAILLFEGEDLVAANRIAVAMLGLDWGSLRQLKFQHLFRSPMPGEAPAPLDLRDGRRVHARCTPEQRRPASAPAPEPVRLPGPAGVFWDAESREQLRLAVRALNADLPVLILGETGTGKEMFARALHASSRRSHKPMVTLNCAAVPEGLIESELFGYEGGAFTGARPKGSPGKIREADGGILFLDEIGDMPLTMQARLLRVLQSREVSPLGGTRSMTVDFVPVCATNRDLEEEVKAGRMRADLFYRLQHFCARLKPLRERPAFHALLDAILQNCGAAERRIQLSSEAREALHAHRWPGNFRELANLLRTLVALADDGACIGLDSLPEELRKLGQAGAAPASAAVPPVPLDALTRQAVEQAIRANQGNMTAAARDLGLHRSTLYRMLQRLPK